MAQRIVFPRKDEVELEEFDLDDVGDGALWLRSTHSLMSTGTEGIALHGLFDDGTHWSRYVRYPFHPGYSTVGAVEAVGPGVTDFAAGDRVVARLGHASDHVVPTKLCTRVPDGIPSEPAVWFGLAKIALMGASTWPGSAARPARSPRRSIPQPSRSSRRAVGAGHESSSTAPATPRSSGPLSAWSPIAGGWWCWATPVRRPANI